MSLFPRYHAHNHGTSNSNAGLSPFWRLLEDPFFVPASSTSSTTGRQMFQPKFDVHETPEAFILDGELPGITDKNALDIHFADQQTLVIHGRVESIRKSGPDSERSPSRKPTVEDADESGEPSKEVSKKEESGEVAKQQQQPGHRVWIQERSVGEFQRSFNFPAGIDQDNVKASLKDGILSIIVPKMQQKGKRRINIE